MLGRKNKVAKLRDKLNKAIQKGKLKDASSLYDALMKAEPTEPRWPHRKADLLRRMGKDHNAIDWYEKAVELYASQGFVARAAATAKVILQIDPDKLDVLERVDPEQARRLHRAQRGKIVTAIDSPSMPPVPPADAPPEVRIAPRRRVSLVLDAATLQRVDSDEDVILFDDVDDGDFALAIDLTDDEVVGRPPTPAPTPDPEPVAQPPAAPAPAPPLSLGRETLELELDDLAIEDDYAEDEVLVFDDEPDRRTAAQLATMPSVSLFAEVPGEALSSIVKSATLIDLEGGAMLVEHGDPADALYVIVEGHVEVRIPEVAQPIPLGEGDVVGESCLLDDVARRADVVTMTRTQALQIPKYVLDDVVEQHPGVGDVLLDLLARRLLGNLLQTSALFAPFEPDTRRELARMFEVRRATEGTNVIEEGKRVDGLYVPLIGELSVTREGQHLGKARLGELIGQASMLSRQPVTATATATTDVLLLRLAAARFNELAATYPTVLMQLTELAASDDIAIVPA